MVQKLGIYTGVLMCILLCVGQVKGHEGVFVSVESIKKSITLDMDIANYLRNHLDDVGEQLHDVATTYIREQEQMEQAGRQMVRNYADTEDNKREDIIYEMAKNPLVAYQTIRRIAMDFSKLSAKLQSLQDFNGTIGVRLTLSNITHDYDVVGTVKGLLRLQDIYHLQAKDLVLGKIRHLDTGSKLTVTECMELAKIANMTKRVDSYVEWAEQAHQVCLNQEDQSCLTTSKEFLQTAVREHDEKLATQQRAYNLLHVAVKTTNASQQLAEKYKYFNPRAYPTHESNLCYASGSLMTSEEESELFCHYLVRDGDPYINLQRFKIEAVSNKPLIWTLYDVVTSEEAALMKTLAAQILVRSTVVGVTDKTLREHSEQRISSTAWLQDSKHPTIAKISQRIQRITGLSTAEPDGEQFQLVNYGIGGMYNAHYDYIHSMDYIETKRNDTSFMGNRLVTFILYLEDVELGGATAFPKAKTAVRPKKGAAALWYNLNKAGVPDPNTFHGGCPVLYGSKWIANKWILEKGQLFRYPCPLEPPEHHD